MFEHVMQSHLTRMHDFFTLDILCQFVNISLKCLKRPLTSRTRLCRASRPLKSVALSYSTNVYIGWIQSSIGGSSSLRIDSITSSTPSNIIAQHSSLLASSIIKEPLMFGLRSIGSPQVSHCDSLNKRA